MEVDNRHMQMALIIIGASAVFYLALHMRANSEAETPAFDVATYSYGPLTPSGYLTRKHYPESTDIWWSQAQNCDTGWSMRAGVNY